MFDGPNDSTSITYGIPSNQYKLCGPYQYTLMEETKTNIISVDNFIIEVNAKTDSEDELTLKLTSASGQENYIDIELDVVLRIQIFRYPLTPPLDFPWTFPKASLMLP